MDRWNIGVLRLDHRIERDKRATMHLFMTARALGADFAYYSGQRDEKIENGIGRVNEAWGESFLPVYRRDWKRLVQEWKEKGGEIVHLTMYGLGVRSLVKEIRESSCDKMIVVGGPKVPGIVYELADWNVSVSSQPHSEISSVGIFLHELFEGRELSRSFPKAKLRIVPNAKGKKVERVRNKVF